MNTIHISKEVEMENIYEKVTRLIEQSKRILVFTGAGISTNTGIPDFRSEKGLYSLVDKEFDLPYPEAIFDIHYFKENPYPFYELTRKMLLQKFYPTLCHRFIAFLESIHKVELVVTQNIDMLHHTSGSVNVLECHGTYRTAHCIECHKPYVLETIQQTILDGEIPTCDCGGVIKPDVVFFGEQVPDGFRKILKQTLDIDMILILGTSLLVQPSSGFALELAGKVPSVLVNKDETDYDSRMTYVLKDDLDKFAKKVWDKLKLE